MQGEMVVNKLIEYIEKIEEYSGHDVKKALADKKTLEACVFNLSQMGEIVKHLDAKYENEHQEIPWRKLYGLRNRIVHDYDGINCSLIEDIISNDLVRLKKQLKKIKR